MADIVLTSAPASAAGDTTVIGAVDGTGAYRKLSLPAIIRDKWESIRIGASNGLHKEFADETCTGADDQDVINTAIASLTAGGRVLLGGGVFYLSAPIIHRKNAVTVLGIGRGHRSLAAVQNIPSTRLIAVSGFSGDAMYIADDEGTGRSPAHAEIGGFTLDGAEITEVTSGDPIHGMKMALRESYVHDVYVASMSGYGIYLYGNSSGDVYNNHMSKVWIRECIGGAGLYITQYAADWNVEGLIVGLINDGAGNGAGLLLDSGGGAGGRFTHCNFYGSVENARFAGTNRLEFVNCSFNDSLQHCMFFDGNQSSSNTWLNFTGCEWRQNGKSTDNTYDMLHFAGDTSNKIAKINITGGCIEKGTVSTECRYAFGKSGTHPTPLLGLQVVGTWVDVAANFGTAHHNLTNTNLIRFLGCANLQDTDTYNAQTAARNKTAVIAGGTAGNRTVTGITIYDRIVSVIHNTAGTLADITSEFTITATNTINNTGGTDTTGDQLLVLYQDNTP